MKVTTTPGDCDKVNQIVPIMQEHLGPVMNLARIKLLAFVVHALCVVQTVSLHKIASAMPTCVERVENPGGGDHVTRERLTPWLFWG